MDDLVVFKLLPAGCWTPLLGDWLLLRRSPTGTTARFKCQEGSLRRYGLVVTTVDGTMALVGWWL